MIFVTFLQVNTFCYLRREVGCYEHSVKRQFETYLEFVSCFMAIVEFAPYLCVLFHHSNEESTIIIVFYFCYSKLEQVFFAIEIHYYKFCSLD